MKNRLSLFSRLFECSAFAQEKKENYKSKEEKSFSYFLSFSFSILIFIFVSATFYSILSLFAFVCYWRSVEKWVTKKTFFLFMFLFLFLFLFNPTPQKQQEVCTTAKDLNFFFLFGSKLSWREKKIVTKINGWRQKQRCLFLLLFFLSFFLFLLTLHKVQNVTMGKKGVIIQLLRKRSMAGWGLQQSLQTNAFSFSFSFAASNSKCFFSDFFSAPFFLHMSSTEFYCRFAALLDVSINFVVAFFFFFEFWSKMFSPFFFSGLYSLFEQCSL